MGGEEPPPGAEIWEQDRTDLIGPRPAPPHDLPDDSLISYLKSIRCHIRPCHKTQTIGLVCEDALTNLTTHIQGSLHSTLADMPLRMQWAPQATTGWPVHGPYCENDETCFKIKHDVRAPVFSRRRRPQTSALGSKSNKVSLVQNRLISQIEISRGMICEVQRDPQLDPCPQYVWLPSRSFGNISFEIAALEPPPHL